MNDEIATIRGVVRELSARPHTSLPDQWRDLAELGLTAVGIPESHGGSGGDMDALCGVLFELGYAGSDVPLLDHSLAAWLYAGLTGEFPTNPTALAFAAPGDDGHRVRTTLRAASHLAHLVLVIRDEHGGTRLHLVPAERITIVLLRHDLPGDTLADVDVDLSALPAALACSDEVVDELHVRTAVMSASVLAGGLARMRDLAIQHARERQQFGRRIGDFQAVQHYVAQLAGNARLADALCSVAARQYAGPARDLYALAARCYAGSALYRSARIAHQVHGASGYTAEHILGKISSRCFATERATGTLAEWNSELGAHARELGSRALWDLVVSPPIVADV